MNNPLRKAIGDFLNIKIIQNSWIYLDLWSIVHAVAGGMIIVILNMFKLNFYWRYGILLSLIIGYEIIEFVLYKNLTTLFIEETWINVIWDLIIVLITAGIIDFVFWVKNM